MGQEESTTQHEEFDPKIARLKAERNGLTTEKDKNINNAQVLNAFYDQINLVTKKMSELKQEKTSQKNNQE